MPSEDGPAIDAPPLANWPSLCFPQRSLPNTITLPVSACISSRLLPLAAGLGRRSAGTRVAALTPGCRQQPDQASRGSTHRRTKSCSAYRPRGYQASRTQEHQRIFRAGPRPVTPTIVSLELALPSQVMRHRASSKYSLASLLIFVRSDTPPVPHRLIKSRSDVHFAPSSADLTATSSDQTLV